MDSNTNLNDESNIEINNESNDELQYIFLSTSNEVQCVEDEPEFLDHHISQQSNSNSPMVDITELPLKNNNLTINNSNVTINFYQK